MMTPRTLTINLVKPKNQMQEIHMVMFLGLENGPHGALIWNFQAQFIYFLFHRLNMKVYLY